MYPDESPFKRVVFMGSADLACPSLERLHAMRQLRIVAVVTQPDRPSGRSLRKTPCPVCAHVAGSGVPVLMPENVNAPENVAALMDIRPDMIVVVAYGQILKPPILSLPPLGCLNLHASLLPEYRGAAPIQWAVAEGEKNTGVTTMFMDEGMDTGDIIFQEKVPIEDDDTAATMHDRLARLGAELLARTVSAVFDGTAPRQSQDSSAATYAPRLKKKDGCIDWFRPASIICNRVRGFNPWPGCFFRVRGARGMSVKVWQARREPRPARAQDNPGCVLEDCGEGPLICAGEDAVRLLSVQPEGRKRMSGVEYMRGYGMRAGDILATS